MFSVAPMPLMAGPRQTTLVLIVALAAYGCAAQLKPSPARLYEQAEQEFRNEAYELAIDHYKALLDERPFSPHAEEAELRIAHAYYLLDRFAEAVAAFADFERMHPTSPKLPFVEYYLGMSYLRQMRSPDRDQQAAANAERYFAALIDRFPDSPYAQKARLRMRECREALASHELGVASFYLRRDNLRAAEARLRSLLRNYPETDASADALYRFAEVYSARDDAERATLARAALLVHYPESSFASRLKKTAPEEPRADFDGRDPLAELLERLDAVGTGTPPERPRASLSASPAPAAASQGY